MGPSSKQRDFVFEVKKEVECHELSLKRHMLSWQESTALNHGRDPSNESEARSKIKHVKYSVFVYRVGTS